MREIKGGQTSTGRIRRKQAMSVAVQYLPPEDAESVSLALLDMAAALYPLLESVPVNGGLYRGNEMRHEITDGVLSFFAEYCVHVLNLEPGEAMAGVPSVSVKPHSEMRRRAFAAS